MKTVELSEATGPLSRYTRQATREPLVITRGGRPFAAVVSIRGIDLEDLSLTTSADFIRLIERSRARYGASGGVSLDEMRRRHRRTGRPAKAKRKSR
jgi:hypothetical protein